MAGRDPAVTGEGMVGGTRVDGMRKGRQLKISRAGRWASGGARDKGGVVEQRNLWPGWKQRNAGQTARFLEGGDLETYMLVGLRRSLASEGFG